MTTIRELMGRITQGVWAVDPKRKLRVATPDDSTVATTGTTDKLRDQWETNARAIALLPELLALAAAVEEFGGFWDFGAELESGDQISFDDPTAFNKACRELGAVLAALQAKLEAK